MRPVVMRAMIVLVSGTGDVFNNVFRDNRSKLIKSRPMRMGALVPHTNDVGFYTISGPTLTEDDVTKLNLALEGVCTIGSLEWRDDSGLYETDFSECLVANVPSGNGFNWHINPESDTEHKLL